MQEVSGSVYHNDVTNRAIADKSLFWARYVRGIPDGRAIDCEGRSWNCRVVGGCIVGVSSDGVIEEVIEFPCANSTSCTFGGNDLRTLEVTSTALGPTGCPANTQFVRSSTTDAHT
jgi:sugar lactone lactonase YvrE